MKLGTLSNGTRDGRLVVVSRDGERFADAARTAPNLQAALDDWERTSPLLRELFDGLTAGAIEGTRLDPKSLRAPLPRAYEWIDGSAFLTHVALVRKARGATVPDSLRTDPLVYQGGSGVLLGPRDPMLLPDDSWGLDFESEICAVLGDVPMGADRSRVKDAVRLFVLANDMTFRNLVPAELAKGFGFFQSKPSTAFSPFAITPDELGEAYRDGRAHIRVETWLNEELVGAPDAGEMLFSFFDLGVHVTKTRALTAGTILGSGTISNEDRWRGVSCLAERRAQEMIELGEARTPYLKVGDTVRIEAQPGDRESLFGAILQEVVRP